MIDFLTTAIKYSNFKIEEKKITLQIKKILILPKNIFRDLTELNEIYFQNNQITELDENIFNDSKKLRTIDFGDADGGNRI